MSDGKRRVSQIVFCLIIVLAIISVSSPSYAVTYEVYTYGGGDFLYYILNGVAMIFSGNIVGSLIVIAAMLLTIMLVSRLFYDSHGSYSTYSGEGAYNIIKVALLTLIAIEVFSIPKADVLIQDRSKPSQTNVVANVPFIQAFAMHASSLIGDRIGEVMEDVFTLPEVIKYRNHGVGLGVKYTNEFMGIYPPDTAYLPYAGQYRVHLLYTVLREYFMTCLFSEFSSPNKDDMTSTAFNAVFTSPNMLNDPSIEALSDTYNKVITGLKINEPTMTCHDALPNIRAAWNDVYSLWVDDLMKKISGRTGAEIGETIGAEAYIEQIINYYSPAMLTPKDMIINIAAVNTLKDAMLVFSARTQNGSSLAEYLSKRKTTAGWMTASRMLNSVIVILRQIFEALVYGLCIFLPLAFVIGGPKAFSTYIKLVFWLNLWVPFYVLLNLLADLRFADAMQNLTELASGGFGLNFRNIEEVQEQANIVIGLIGAAAWTVPTFAWGVISGGGYAVSSVMQSMASKSSAYQTSYQAGAEVSGAGNVSAANRSAGNESYRSSDAITSSGSLHSGWVNSLSMQGALNEIGLDNAVSGSRNNQLYSYGSGSGLKDKAYSSGMTKGELTGGGLAGAKEVAGGYFNDDAWAMSLAESVQQHTAKGEQYGKIGESLGFMDSKDAAAVAGVLQGDQGFANLMSFYKTKGAVGLKGLIDAGAGKETIQASQTLSALSSMAHHGMTPTDFGGAKGMVDTARSIGNVEAFQSQFQQAKDQGFAGDEADFMKTRAEADYAKGFASGQKMQQFADRNYGGSMQNMFKAETGWQYGRVMGAVSKAQQQGWNPETLGEYMGAMESVSAMGKAGAYDLLGDEGYRQSEQGRVLNEGAKFDMLKMAASKAGFAGNDGAVGGEEMYNFLQAHQGNVGMVLSDGQAQQMGLGEQGGRYMASFTPKGEMMFSQAEAGSKATFYDVSNAQISRGASFDGTLLRMALSGDTAMVGGMMLGNKFQNPSAKDAEITYISSKISESLSGILSQRGMTADYSRGEAGIRGSASTPSFVVGASAYAAGSIGALSEQQETVNLLTSQYSALIKSSLHEASSMGLNQSQTVEKVAGDIGEFTQAINHMASGKISEDYGTTVLIPNSGSNPAPKDEHKMWDVQ